VSNIKNKEDRKYKGVVERTEFPFLTKNKAALNQRSLS
jgi:hypothetical protein